MNVLSPVLQAAWSEADWLDTDPFPVAGAIIAAVYALLSFILRRRSANGTLRAWAAWYSWRWLVRRLQHSFTLNHSCADPRRPSAHSDSPSTESEPELMSADLLPPAIVSPPRIGLRCRCDSAAGNRRSRVLGASRPPILPMARACGNQSCLGLRRSGSTACCCSRCGRCGGWLSCVG